MGNIYLDAEQKESAATWIDFNRAMNKHKVVY